MVYPYNTRFKITSVYGERYFNGQNEFHSGLDLVGLANDADGKYICAIADGVVGASQIVTSKSNKTWEWGNYVRIDGDDGNKYYYCHLSKRLVRTGTRVKAGAHIGIEGSTGYSTGSHLHLEIRTPLGNTTNPANFLKIMNSIGEYGVDYKALLKKSYGLSKQTMDFLHTYEFPYSFYKRLCEKCI